MTRDDDALYYVLMAEPDRYLNEDGKPGDYNAAEKFDQPLPRYLDHVQKQYPQARWVGPCWAGERP